MKFKCHDLKKIDVQNQPSGFWNDALAEYLIGKRTGFLYEQIHIASAPNAYPLYEFISTMKYICSYAKIKHVRYDVGS